jgi:hypothetical protein
MKFSTTFVLLSSLATAARGFLVFPTPSNTIALNAEVDNEIDFDGMFQVLESFLRIPSVSNCKAHALHFFVMRRTAPSDRAAAVGNVVKSQKPSPFNAVPKFLADAFGVKMPVFGGEFIMDDECYLGKDGALDECVDFDPTHSSP